MSYRHPSEAPITVTEQYLNDLLLATGYKEEDIQFTETSSGSRYLRVGYWKRIELLGVEDILTEVSHYDEDCGDLFHYEITELVIDEDEVQFFSTFEATGTYPM